MDFLKTINNETILIIPNNIKNKIIKFLNKQEKLIAIKILTFKELKESMLFNYDEKAILYLKEKYNYKYNIAKEYIENIYYVLDDENKNDKLELLLNIKNELIDNKLLYINNLFFEFIKNKNIYFYGFDYISKYQQKLIDILNKYSKVNIIDKNNKEYFNNKVYIFDNINDEIEFIANDIIEKKLDFNKTYIYGINNDNESTIKRIFSNYYIKINIKSEKNLLDTQEGLNFINNLHDIEHALKSIKDNTIKQKIINILNDFYFIDDKNSIKNIIIEKFKSCQIPNLKYEKQIEQIDIKDNIFNEDEHVYIINFNREYIPNIFKNEDFINDEEKPYYLEKTVEKNNNEINTWKNILKNIKNLTITASMQSIKGSLELSPLIEEFKMNTEKKEYNISKYSNISNKYNLAVQLDNYFRFNIENKSLPFLLSMYPDINYLKYNNKYTKVILENTAFPLSYSKINTYYECQFKYYLDNVLKLNIFNETFDTWSGSLTHHILSKIVNDDFDFDKEKDEFIKNNAFDLTLENKVFLEKILNELKTAIKYIKSLHLTSKYKEIECEKKIELKIDNISFIGVIDKIMKYDNNIVLVDYKTGNPSIDLKYCKHGLNLQLPTYLYLIKHIYPDSNIVGIYLQHILKPLITNDEKNPDEIYEEHLKLDGYTLGQEEYIKDFDPTYENSAYIKSMKVTQNGFAKYTKVLTKNDFKDLENLVNDKIKECINNIKKASFEINPKIIGKNNISCEFCNYKSICFVEEKNYKYIKLDEDKEGEENANMD